ncbi:CFI-box-CTERM domain-containing protein [Chloroflexota bacterium]
MKKRLLISLVLVVLLTAGIVPRSTFAAEGGENLLTPAEETFFFSLGSQIASARESLNGYRSFLRTISTKEGGLNWAMSGMPMPKPFEGCAFPVSVPETVSDIAGMWDTEVCNEFGYMSTKLDSLKLTLAGQSPTGMLLDLVNAMTLVNQTANQIDSSLAAIEALGLERIDELNRTRQTAKEAEQEAKKELNLDDDFCFIATAAYGTPTAEGIDVLRQFRDDFLRDSSPGNAFIDFYYRNSPPLANFIAEHEVLRILVRDVLVDPVVAAVTFTRSWWRE